MRQSLTRDQVRRLDAIATEELGFPGVVLMENAGRGAAKIVQAAFSEKAAKRVVIFCGGGNNGGDGFVVARHLSNAGVPVLVRLAVAEEDIRGDALVNYRILRNIGTVVVPVLEREGVLVPAVEPDDLVVDALLGTGFRGQVRTPLAELIRGINAAAKRHSVAIDVPSGLDCDTGRPGGVAVRADSTVTFVAPKVGFSRSGALEWTGEIHVVDIGTPPALIDRVLLEE